MAPTFWTGGLQGSGPPRLADRLETQRNALAVLRQAGALRDWEADGPPQRLFGRGLRGEQVLAERVGAVRSLRPIADRAERVLQQWSR